LINVSLFVVAKEAGELLNPSAPWGYEVIDFYS